MEISSAEEIRCLVAAGIGASILPFEGRSPTYPFGKPIMRPLKPPLIRTLGLVQRRDKPVDLALEHVRDTLLARLPR